MKKTNITYLKANLSGCLKMVKEGGEILVTDRKKPIAVIKPYDNATEDEEMASLIADGIVIPPKKGKLDVEEFLKMPTLKGIPSLSEVIIEERNER